MNITAELAEKTLALIAEINQAQPADGQVTKPASHAESVETLTALNYGRLMQRIMEEDDWRETAETLQELVANWMGQYRRRDLRHMAKDWVQEPEDKSTSKLLELWVTDNDLMRLAQLVTERKFPEPRTPVCFAVSDARRAVKSTLNFVRHDRKLTPEEMDQVLRELDENRDEYDHIASLGMLDEPQDQETRQENPAIPNVVYALTNPAMPGLVKIGMTDRERSPAPDERPLHHRSPPALRVRHSPGN